MDESEQSIDELKQKLVRIRKMILDEEQKKTTAEKQLRLHRQRIQKEMEKERAQMLKDARKKMADVNRQTELEREAVVERIEVVERRIAAGLERIAGSQDILKAPITKPAVEIGDINELRKKVESLRERVKEMTKGGVKSYPKPKVGPKLYRGSLQDIYGN